MEFKVDSLRMKEACAAITHAMLSYDGTHPFLYIQLPGKGCAAGSFRVGAHLSAKVPGSMADKLVVCCDLPMLDVDIGLGTASRQCYMLDSAKFFDSVFAIAAGSTMVVDIAKDSTPSGFSISVSEGSKDAYAVLLPPRISAESMYSYESSKLRKEFNTGTEPEVTTSVFENNSVVVTIKNAPVYFRGALRGHEATEAERLGHPLTQRIMEFYTTFSQTLCFVGHEQHITKVEKEIEMDVKEEVKEEEVKEEVKEEAAAVAAKSKADAAAEEKARKRRSNEEVMQERLNKAIELLQANGYSVVKHTCVADVVTSIDTAVKFLARRVAEAETAAEVARQEVSAAKCVDINAQVEQLFKERVKSAMASLVGG